MELLGVRLELPANTPVVLLREQDGDRRVLPIYIGPEEAKAIALALEGVSTPRPMSHDLMRDLLGAIGATVGRIVVTELQGGVYVEVASGRTVTVERPFPATVGMTPAASTQLRSR